jgi:hypothetical protein
MMKVPGIDGCLRVLALVGAPDNPADPRGGTVSQILQEERVSGRGASGALASAPGVHMVLTRMPDVAILALD